MTIDINNLTPSPWEVATGSWGNGGIYPYLRVVHESEHDCQRDAEFITLARSDLDVKQRLGWHTERCTESDQWRVPQLLEYTIIEPDREDADAYVESCILACYQKHHDVGLLTKAYKWYRERQRERGV